MMETKTKTKQMKAVRAIEILDMLEADNSSLEEAGITKSDFARAISAAKSALKGRIPAQYVKSCRKQSAPLWYSCPRCGADLACSTWIHFPKYCKECGQRMDWKAWEK